jgi:hypothetical protein
MPANDRQALAQPVCREGHPSKHSLLWTACSSNAAQHREGPAPAPVVVVPHEVHIGPEQVPALRPEARGVEDLLAHEQHVQVRVEGHLQKHVRAAQLEACARERRVRELAHLRSRDAPACISLKYCLM